MTATTDAPLVVVLGPVPGGHRGDRQHRLPDPNGIDLKHVAFDWRQVFTLNPEAAFALAKCVRVAG